ncbi:hypothetical protein CBR_g20266 [Chara braunii]|uniref:TPM domain-containing protein n=1 Tax=Chara braunii TaxID=69332 RepID=A0A388L000_CHABU|nr:hypothetical protein CBR_g20266 [Chara braunii]|eukprot:GBG75637.1 hypothetical protein CBR_g20266 [Chara braunii]
MAVVLLLGSGSVLMASSGQAVQRMDDRHVSFREQHRRVGQAICPGSAWHSSVPDLAGGGHNGGERSPTAHPRAAWYPPRFPSGGRRRAARQRASRAAAVVASQGGRRPLKSPVCMHERNGPLLPKPGRRSRAAADYAHVAGACHGRYPDRNRGAVIEEAAAFNGLVGSEDGRLTSARPATIAQGAGGGDGAQGRRDEGRGGGSTTCAGGCEQTAEREREGAIDIRPHRDRDVMSCGGLVGRQIATWAVAAAASLLFSAGGEVLSVGQALATAEPGPGIPTAPTAIIDSAGSIPPAKRALLSAELAQFESETGWKLRILTRFRQGEPPSQQDVLKFWKPDERTILVIEDVTSPNILNFNAGSLVLTKLPRQFFVELQSRFGNLFYVREEGEQRALLQAVDAIRDCLQREKGCRFVPGVTDDLYILTLATSIVGGAVFGFAARIPPSGSIDYPWQWILIFSPLWGILLGSFGILPVVSRTSDLLPVIKNLAAFAATGLAMYLTPIFGTPRGFSGEEEGGNNGDGSR